MTPDTPLAEVAHHLSTSAAKFMLRYPEEMHEDVLMHVRSFICYLEDGVGLDAIQFDQVVNGYVASVAPLIYSGRLAATYLEAARVDLQVERSLRDDR